jgi:hypothetical protein
VSKQRGSKAKSKSKVKRTAEAVPWAVVMRGGVIVGKRWVALSAKERARLTELVRESRGRLSNLSARQRLELRKLARKLDLTGMGSELLPLLRSEKRSRRKRH